MWLWEGSEPVESITKYKSRHCLSEDLSKELHAVKFIKQVLVPVTKPGTGAEIARDHDPCPGGLTVQLVPELV